MQAPTKTLISVEEYLSTSYRPDCDYVNGQIEERNLGERTHGRLQARLAGYFIAHQSAWGGFVMTELRIRVKPDRVRIPDVCVTLGDPGEEVLTKPPFLCIEILSPEDRMSRVRLRIQDFLDMGVPYVWVLDPQTRRAYIATAADGLREVRDGVLRTESPAFEIPLAELFE
jgi:Uma2 family endonuclease